MWPVRHALYRGESGGQTKDLPSVWRSPAPFLPPSFHDDKSLIWRADRSILSRLLPQKYMQCNGYSDLFEAVIQQHHQHNCFRIGRRLFGVMVMCKLERQQPEECCKTFCDESTSSIAVDHLFHSTHFPVFTCSMMLSDNVNVE